MKPLPHRYDVRLTGASAGYAELSTPGVPKLQVAPPADYDGPGDAWTPEHLLLASVQACFLFTLRAVARFSKQEFLSLELDATGTVNRIEGVTRFSEIVLRPTITVAAGSDRDRVIHILERSKNSCLVSASLATPIRLESRIKEE
jgi:peroxiredoxin-like protein